MNTESWESRNWGDICDDEDFTTNYQAEEHNDSHDMDMDIDYLSDTEDVESRRLYVDDFHQQKPVKLNIKRLHEKIFDDDSKTKNENLEKERIEKENEEYKEIMKNKLSWVSSPNKRKFVLIENDLDADDFPCLGAKPIKKIKKEIVVESHEPKPTCSHDDGGWMQVKKKERKQIDEPTNSVSFTCTKMCSTWYAGNKCINKRCSYAHTIDELRISDCKFANCNMVTKQDGLFYNVNKDKTCNNIHICESKDNYLQRLGLKKSTETTKPAFALDVMKPKQTVKTQICKSVKEKTKCPHGKNCRFAHTFAELVVNDCAYGERCKGIKFDSGRYSNTSSSRICTYKHPGESKDNYKFRVL